MCVCVCVYVFAVIHCHTVMHKCLLSRQWPHPGVILPFSRHISALPRVVLNCSWMKEWCMTWSGWQRHNRCSLCEGELLQFEPSASGLHRMQFEPSASGLQGMQFEPSTSGLHRTQFEPSASGLYRTQFEPSASAEDAVVYNQQLSGL